MFALATALGVAIPAAPAFAQATADPAPVAEAAVEEGVADIVVTATRRSENLQDIPLSVTAVSGEKLDVIASGGADIRFLSARVPSLLVEIFVRADVPALLHPRPWQYRLRLQRVAAGQPRL